MPAEPRPRGATPSRRSARAQWERAVRVPVRGNIKWVRVRLAGGSQAGRQVGGPAGRQTGWQAGRQAGRLEGRQAGRQERRPPPLAAHTEAVAWPRGGSYRPLIAEPAARRPVGRLAGLPAGWLARFRGGIGIQYQGRRKGEERRGERREKRGEGGESSGARPPSISRANSRSKQN